MSEIKEGNLAEIKDLSVSFMTDAGSIKAIDKISFEIPRKKVIGVVGESGSGKSVTARSLIKLLPETATTSGAVYLSNRAGTEELEVLSLSGEQLREMRGAEAAMVFQEPNSVLNPVYTIGWQIEEGLRAHGMKDKKELRAKSIDILKKVGIPDAETRIDYYPHQFSGGQKQRIVIAMALVLNPGLILADEPTTALDVTVQAEILDLLRLARDEFDASVLIITHNMGVIADIADEVVVMYRGHVVEQAASSRSSTRRRTTTPSVCLPPCRVLARNWSSRMPMARSSNVRRIARSAHRGRGQGTDHHVSGSSHAA